MGFLDKLARNRVLKQAGDAATRSHEQGRLVFGVGDRVVYTDKEGKSQTLTLDGCAGLFWQKMNEEVIGAAGSSMVNLATLNVTPEDIREIIVELRDKKK